MQYILSISWGTFLMVTNFIEIRTLFRESEFCLRATDLARRHWNLPVALRQALLQILISFHKSPANWDGIITYI